MNLMVEKHGATSGWVVKRLNLEGVGGDSEYDQNTSKNYHIHVEREASKNMLKERLSLESAVLGKRDVHMWKTESRSLSLILIPRSTPEC